MLKQTGIALSALFCMVAVGDVVNNAWAGMRGAFSGQYIIYGGYLDAKGENSRAPTPGDTKIAFSIRGAAAKDMFDAIGAAPREKSRGEESCKENPKIRIRDLDTIRCRFHPSQSYWCTFGFDLSTGLSTWGKVGDAGCD